MWAKVLAGVMAAVSVAGVGVYVAQPHGGWQCERCPTRGPGVPADIPAPAKVVTAEPDALAACTGGMAISASAPAKACATACPCGAE